MNCDAAGRLLDDYLENGLSQRDRQLMEEHLARCRHCAEEVRRRPALERDLQRALAASVHPLYLSSDASTRIVEAAEVSLHRAIWSHRATLTFRLMTGAVAAALLVIGLFALLGQIPVPSGFRPIALLPLNNLRMSEAEPVVLSSGEQPTHRIAAASAGSLPRASLLFEPEDMRPEMPFTMTLLLQSDTHQPLEAVGLDLDITGPTGSYSFGLSLKGPLPAHGVSIFRVTPELLAGQCEEHYLVAPTDVFGLPGAYTLRATLYDAVAASE
jgi:hypothetical protein